MYLVSVLARAQQTGRADKDLACLRRLGHRGQRAVSFSFFRGCPFVGTHRPSSFGFFRDRSLWPRMCHRRDPESDDPDHQLVLLPQQTRARQPLASASSNLAIIC